VRFSGAIQRMPWRTDQFGSPVPNIVSQNFRREAFCASPADDSLSYRIKRETGISASWRTESTAERGGECGESSAILVEVDAVDAVMVQ
jgi:hypothetical protein